MTHVVARHIMCTGNVRKVHVGRAYTVRGTKGIQKSGSAALSRPPARGGVSQGVYSVQCVTGRSFADCCVAKKIRLFGEVPFVLLA
jgi:hypothetical protein